MKNEEINKRRVFILFLTLSVFIFTSCENKPNTLPPTPIPIPSIPTPKPTATPKPETIQDEAKKFANKWIDERFSKQDKFFKRCGVVKNDADEVSDIMTVENLTIYSIIGDNRADLQINWIGKVNFKATLLTTQSLTNPEKKELELIRQPDLSIPIIKYDEEIMLGDKKAFTPSDADVSYNYWYGVKVLNLTPFPCSEVKSAISQAQFKTTPTPYKINEEEATDLIQRFVGYFRLNLKDSVSSFYLNKLSTKYRAKNLTLDEIEKFNNYVGVIGTDKYIQNNDNKASIDAKIIIKTNDNVWKSEDFYTFTFVIENGKVKIDNISPELPLNEK